MLSFKPSPYQYINDLTKSPNLFPSNEKKVSHSFLLISMRNIVFKSEWAETRLQGSTLHFSGDRVNLKSRNEGGIKHRKIFCRQKLANFLGSA